MKNILVTGGAGYIGSHCVVELVKAGYKPIVVDNFSNSDESVLVGLQKVTGKPVTLYKGDYQDRALLGKILNEHKIDGVIHFAAYKSVEESVVSPLKYFQNNVASLIELLEVLEDAKIGNFIFSSSCVVYGEADKLPLTEDSPLKPAASPYGSTKQIGEMIIADTTQASKTLKALALRYFNPIGAHPSALIGEQPVGEPTILVARVVKAAVGLQKDITIHGNDYQTPDGTCIRDYIHVVDLAKAHVKALDYLINKSPRYYDVFNIGTGKGSSVLEVIKTFEQATGQKVPYKIGPRRAGDIVSSYAQAAKANKILNWKAELSLADALKDAWRWQVNLTNS